MHTRLVLFLLLASAAPSPAQKSTGEIRGTVVDPTNAAVPGLARLGLIPLAGPVHA